jgi:hypothetical protein
MDTPKASNSSGMNARPKPTSSRPWLMLSTIASSPASLIGWLNAGITAPVMRRMRRVRAASAESRISGLGVWPP